MQRAVPSTLALFLLSLLALTLLPPACAQGEGQGLVGATTSAHASSSSHAASTGTGGMGGAASAAGTGGSFGGAGGAVGVGGAGGGPTSCDNNPSGCNGCTACANAGPCASAWAMCMNTPGCVDYMNCLTGCGGDPCCGNNCVTLYLDGSTAYGEYSSTCLCPTCFNDCTGVGNC